MKKNFAVASHTWRSMVDEFKLLRSGLEWSIGNEQSYIFLLDMSHMDGTT